MSEINLDDDDDDDDFCMSVKEVGYERGKIQ